MNEQLQSALVEILSKTISGIDASVAFMQAELPDVIEQLLTWYATKGLVMCVTGLVVLFVMIRFDMHVFKSLKNSDDCDTFEIVLFYGGLGSVVRLVYMLPLSMINIEWLQIWIAPKIWLIEYAAQLAK